MAILRLSRDAVATGVELADKDALIEDLATRFSQNYGLDRQDSFDRLRQRERLGSTGFGNGIAFPHGKLDGLDQPVAICMKLANPIDFGAADGQPVDMVFGLLSPEQGGSVHLQALAALSRCMRDEKTVAMLRGTDDTEKIFTMLESCIGRIHD